MSNSPYCPQCGNSAGLNTPGGLCAACLLKPGLAPSQTTAYQRGFTAPSIAELAPLFPELEIIQLLGQGGMGAVYQARQLRLDRMVALKILPKVTGYEQEFANRFAREARAMARLNHPSIVNIHDFGDKAGWCYFIMEYVDGINLRHAIQTKSVEPQEALGIVGQICDALHYAHQVGIVHRDIKPENILLEKRGRVKIADFGLAKLLDKNNLTRNLTGTNQVMGTVGYMAPEQMEGSREVDQRADIFSLGVVFYELLTGELPMGRFLPPSKKVQVDVRIDEVVLKTLEREPDRRYQHASQIKDEMDLITRGPAPRQPQVQPINSQWTSQPWFTTLAAIFTVFSLGLGSGLLTWSVSSFFMGHSVRVPLNGWEASEFQRVAFPIAGVMLFLLGMTSLSHALSAIHRQGPRLILRLQMFFLTLLFLISGSILLYMVINEHERHRSLTNAFASVIVNGSEAAGWITALFLGGLSALVLAMAPITRKLIKYCVRGLGIFIILFIAYVALIMSTLKPVMPPDTPQTLPASTRASPRVQVNGIPNE
jgi:serine/threonine protein kinase